MLAIKYVTILYTPVLIVAVIWTMDKCGGRCLGIHCRITAIKISVIHINFSCDLLFTVCNGSLGLLTPLYIHVKENSTYSQYLRVCFNGELQYFSKEHLPYALPAIFCLLTVGLFPPALLLTYPLLNRCLTILGLDDQEWSTSSPRSSPLVV